MSDQHSDPSELLNSTFEKTNNVSESVGVGLNAILENLGLDRVFICQIEDDRLKVSFEFTKSDFNEHLMNTELTPQESTELILQSMKLSNYEALIDIPGALEEAVRNSIEKDMVIEMTNDPNTVNDWHPYFKLAGTQCEQNMIIFLRNKGLIGFLSLQKTRSTRITHAQRKGIEQLANSVSQIL